MQDNPVKKRASRFWLYGPTVLLVLLAVGWSAAWFVLRGRAEGMIDAQLAREASRGRNWSCPGRGIGGFPFRFEITCATLSYAKGPVSVSIGPAKIVTQVYDPRHIIVEAAGPLQATDGTVTITGKWKTLEASIAGLRPGGFDRVSLVTEKSAFTAEGLPEFGQASLTADGASLHIRPTPNAGGDTFDIAMGATGATVPLLDVWLGDDQPLEVETQATLNRARAFADQPFFAGLENWRAQGGVLKLDRLDTRKGLRILNFKGEFALDELHRIQATIQASQANYSDLMAQLMSGNRRALQPLPPDAAKTPVVALPPVYLTNGKIRIAMFDVPKVRLQPLY